MNDVAPQVADGSTTAAETPEPQAPYDPKAIFCEEWARVVPKTLEERPVETVWDEIQPDLTHLGRVLGVIPVETFRLVCRSTAHAWCGYELLRASEEHTGQADAFKKIATRELRVLERMTKAECVGFDLSRGTLRECSHKEDEHPAAVTAFSIPVTAGLAELLKKVGVLGGT